MKKADRRLKINIVPVAWQRPRAAKGAGHFFTAAKVTEFKEAVRLAWNEKYPDAPVLDGPLIVMLIFIMPRPKAMLWKKKPMPQVPHTKRPDLDNLEKGIMDALEGLAFRDDAQIFSKSSAKWIAAGNEQPAIDITIVEVSGC